MSQLEAFPEILAQVGAIFLMRKQGNPKVSEPTLFANRKGLFVAWGQAERGAKGREVGDGGGMGMDEPHATQEFPISCQGLRVSVSPQAIYIRNFIFIV